MQRMTWMAAIAALAAGPAMAGSLEPAPAEPVVMAPAPVAAAPVGIDWTGFYIGGQIGYGTGTVNYGPGDNEDLDGILGGVHAGYLHDFGRVVAGGEVAYNFANMEFEGPTVGELDQLAHAKLKLGYDMGRALIYGTAGGAWANIKADGSTYSDMGWTVGAGLDFLVRDNITAGVEYSYNRFDDFDDTGNDVTANTIAARIGFRF